MQDGALIVSVHHRRHDLPWYVRLFRPSRATSEVIVTAYAPGGPFSSYGTLPRDSSTSFLIDGHVNNLHREPAAPAAPEVA